MSFDTTIEFARKLDERDELSQFRSQFLNAEPGMVYMDGNSLGKLPLRTIGRVEEIIRQEWGTRLIRSWGEQWFTAPIRVGEKIAQLVGAAEGQVAIGDSTSVNLYKMVVTALTLQPERTKIITDVLNFPSDLYILQGCNRLLGNRHTIQMMPSADNIQVDIAALLDAIDETTALVTLSHVVFKSGYMYDAQRITEHAHSKGALVLWDLSHSVGSVPVELDRWQADFAVGCTYKYLNGGPGAPAFLYVRKDLQEKALSPMWGWFGDNTPFAFNLEYAPAEGIHRFLCGTPSILSLQSMESGVDLMLEVGMDRLRAKSIELTSYLVNLYDALLEPLGFQLGSPREITRRGSHISIRHSEGYRINRALIEELNVIPDFREPDNIRLGLAPIYTSFEDVWETIDRIRRAVVEERHLHYPATRLVVT
jgi:kynureninase